MNLQTHQFNQPIELRTFLKDDGSICFVAKDVCEALGISNDRDAISILEDDEKGVGFSDTLGGRQNVNIISEAGLYRLIFRSNKPNAKKFTRWVTHEVLPSIRKTGSYGRKNKNLDDLVEEIKENLKQGDMKQMAFDTGIPYGIVLAYLGDGLRKRKRVKREYLEKMVAWVKQSNSFYTQAQLSL